MLFKHKQKRVDDYIIIVYTIKKTYKKIPTDDLKNLGLIDTNPLSASKNIVTQQKT